MNIHTLDDKTYNLNKLPEVIDDIHFAILDNSNPKEVDYFFPSLIFLESFTSPAIVLLIDNKYHLKLPMDWHLLIGEEEAGDLEAIPLTSINDRNFKAFEYNSLSAFSAEFRSVEVVNVYNEVEWFIPKIKNGQYLAVPIEDGSKPKVIYLINNPSRNAQIVDYSQAW